MTSEAPRAFNREMYHDHPENVFYGTDDGCQDGSFTEFAEIKAHYNGVATQRREDIHMISVVGGLYGLNLIPLWRPRRLTFFDVNPAALTYFQIIRRVWTTSPDVTRFLARLTNGDYEVDGEMEEFIRENIRLKQRGCLPQERGSTSRSYEKSWQHAFEHFDLTKRILSEAPLEIRSEGGFVRAVDLGSTNGSYVNGHKLDGSTELVDGSTITMGRTKIIFRLLTVPPNSSDPGGRA